MGHFQSATIINIIFFSLVCMYKTLSRTEIAKSYYMDIFNLSREGKLFCTVVVPSTLEPALWKGPLCTSSHQWCYQTLKCLYLREIFIFISVIINQVEQCVCMFISHLGFLFCEKFAQVFSYFLLSVSIDFTLYIIALVHLYLCLFWITFWMLSF